MRNLHRGCVVHHCIGGTQLRRILEDFLGLSLENWEDLRNHFFHFQLLVQRMEDHSPFERELQQPEIIVQDFSFLNEKLGRLKISTPW